MGLVNRMKLFLNKYALLLGVFVLLVSCTQKQERVVTPYGSVLDSANVVDEFDLAGIQTSGELIMATLNGPETYYDYHGRQLGTQYLICQHFADSLGSWNVGTVLPVSMRHTSRSMNCSRSRK